MAQLTGPSSDAFGVPSDLIDMSVEDTCGEGGVRK